MAWACQLSSRRGARGHMHSRAPPWLLARACRSCRIALCPCTVSPNSPQSDQRHILPLPVGVQLLSNARITNGHACSTFSSCRSDCCPLCEKPLFHLIQIAPLCMIFSLFLWFVGVLATISQQPELLIEVLIHFVSVMPQYVTFAAPRMWSRFSHHMQYTREDTANSTALPPHVSVLSPPATPGWYAAGAPLAILWCVRWGGVP